jgi:transposase
MDQQHLFEPIPTEKFDLLTREELVIILKGEQSLRIQFQKDNDRLRALNNELKQKNLFVDEQLITIKNKLFGKSSERSKKSSSSKTQGQNKKKKVLLPSERYPNAPLIERHITLDKMPACSCCGSEMQDSGLTEESEYLTKIPAQYYVVVQVRHKYACRSCHGDIKTAPTPPRIQEGSAYSDELAIDVAVSKYCDLIPIERQARMAAREGLKELPPQSLIESTHYLADFVKSAYLKVGEECLQSQIMHADETPHRMLEGDKKCNWYLWGFSTPVASYFEYHDNRASNVALEFLTKSKTEFLVSDVYTGYGKAVKEANMSRTENGRPLISHVYCNAHARRYFKQAGERFPEESKFYIQQYRKIYRLEKLARKNPLKVAEIRARAKKYFIKIRDKSIADVGGYSGKSKLGKAMNYFLKNYEGLTRFLDNPLLPIDNNPQERLLRSPVIGRKTWYGTHSKRGAETAAILFTLMESCKLNGVNPREYFKNLVQHLHLGKTAFTPSQFKDLNKNKDGPAG